MRRTAFMPFIAVATTLMFATAAEAVRPEPGLRIEKSDPFAFTMPSEPQVYEATNVAGDCSSWHATELEAGWTEDQLSTLDMIARGESGCGHDTFNERTGDSGFFQLNPVHCKWLGRQGFPVNCGARKRDRVRALAEDPVLSIRAARLLYEQCGWGPWAPHWGKKYYCRRP